MKNRNMKETNINWIGKIPENWKLTKTKYIYETHKDIVGARVDNFERLALTLKGVVKRSKEDTEGLQPKNFVGYQILKENELVFKLIDLQNISTSRVGLSPYDGIVSPAYIILKANKGVSPNYGKYYFLSLWQREIFNHIGDDGVRSSLNVIDLLNIPIINPSLEEQEKIAEFLDNKCAKIDNINQKIQEEINKLEQYKKSIIYESITKGLNKNKKLKESNIECIGKIPKNWEIVKTKYLYTNHKDIVGIFANNYERLALTLKGVVKRSKEDTEGLQPKNFAGYQIIKENELVFKLIDLQNISTSRVGLSPYEGIVSPAYIILKANKGVSPNYGKYYFLSLWQREIFNHIGDDGVRSSLNVIDLLNIPIINPSLEEQEEIAEYLDKKCLEIDNIIELKKREIENLENYKKSIIYEYVTGKKQVI